MTTLSTYGDRTSSASGINNSGQVVGSSAWSGFGTHAFATGLNGSGWSDLGTLGGVFTSSFATGINDSGQVVGGSNLNGGTGMHAFITGSNGQFMSDLGTLGGTYSWATGINDSGQVVGHSFLSGDGSYHAFITGPNGVGMIDLGVLSSNAGSIYSEARGINDIGQVVGGSSIDSNNLIHAFITGADGIGMVDLNSLVTLEDGEFFTYAYDINDLGQVIAGTNNNRAYLLTPDRGATIPEPSTHLLVLTGFGLLGLMIQGRSRSQGLNTPQPLANSLHPFR